MKRYSLSFLLFYPVDFLLAMCFWLVAPLFKNYRSKAPWVIGGHRGRIYEDNSAALHTYIVNHTDQNVIWIANKNLVCELRAKGYKVLRRNSFKARLAILKAPVLIYSHGEDDLDQFLKYFRKRLGLRIYLNHSANFCKTGYFATPEAASWDDAKRKAMAKKIVDFDYLLAGSKYEREMFKRAFPVKDENRILPDCGAAHMDKLITSGRGELDRRILWFPTFRDEDCLKTRLVEMENSVFHSKRLQKYLEENKITLTLVSHVNSGNSLTSSFPYITVESVSKLGELLPKSMCLISDYSGLTIDWIVFDRPFIRFAYDEQDYMRKRSFYIPLGEFLVGPEARNLNDLEEILISERWKDMTPYVEKRAYFKGKIYPESEPVYAARSFDAIRKLLAYV